MKMFILLLLFLTNVFTIKLYFYIHINVTDYTRKHTHAQAESRVYLRSIDALDLSKLPRNTAMVPDALKTIECMLVVYLTM